MTTSKICESYIDEITKLAGEIKPAIETDFRVLLFDVEIKNADEFKIDDKYRKGFVNKFLCWVAERYNVRRGNLFHCNDSLYVNTREPIDNLTELKSTISQELGHAVAEHINKYIDSSEQGKFINEGFSTWLGLDWLAINFGPEKRGFFD